MTLLRSSRLVILALSPCLPPLLAATAADAAAGPAQSVSQATGKKRYARGFQSEPAASAPAPEAALGWEPFVGMDAQIFPSFIVSTATLRLPQEEDEAEDPRQLGEPLGFIGAAIEGVPANSRIRVEVKPNGVMDASVFDGRADDGPGRYEVYPKLNYRFDALLDWRQPMPLNITMEAYVNGRSLGTRSTTVTVRSINDCPFAVLADAASEDEDLDLSWMFAAYVNENHPWVETLTREALDSRIVDGFSAYQDGKAATVLQQVYAIWHTLHRRGMRYSDISRPSTESDVVLSQHVRLLDESVTAQQANCVDGSVAIAAVLRKVGIESYLVIVPGHMFLAFDLDAEGKQTLGLETTVMGVSDLGDAPVSRRIPKALAARFRGQASFQSFSAAIEEGTALLTKYRRELEGDDADHQMISLDEARRMGILPLAYRRK